MKKISNWSLVGSVTGLTLIAVSLIRYFIIWLDYSQGIEFISIGILICTVSWLYNRNLQQDKERKHLQDKVDAVEEYLAELNEQEVKI